MCLDELSRTGDPLREARGMVKEYQDVMQVLRGISPEKGDKFSIAGGSKDSSTAGGEGSMDSSTSGEAQVYTGGC